MSYLNQVMLIGNLGKDPEVLVKKDKGTFVKCQLATTKKYKNAKNQKVEDTQWHTVYLNNGSAEFAQNYLKKGDKVLIIGELRTNKWDDKEGVTHYSTSIFAKECQSLSGKSQPRPTADVECVEAA